MEDEELKALDRLDAMEFIRRCSGIGREKPAQGKHSAFMVVSASREEISARLAEYAAPDTTPATRQ
jgi:hypothetical protein